jgi:4'-phosphopantetheinyl transferase
MRWFAPDEIRALCALPSHHRARLFVRLWALKEAYLKARGLGLSIDLRQIGFAFGPTTVELVTGCDNEDAPGRWCFEELEPTPRHHLAVAVRRSVKGPCRQVIRVLEVS